jgi:hypothetical protein
MLTQNSKLKKANIWSFNLTPVVTCPGSSKEPTSPCCSCYGSKGCHTMYKNVSKGWDKNLTESQGNSFIKNMILEIRTKKAKIVRMHATGDFYSQDYLEKWFEIADQCPDVLFYCYTKSLHLDWSMKPKNMTMVQSLGGQFDSLIDWEKPVAHVFPNKEALEASGYTNGSDNDLVAALGFKRVGLIKH